MFANGGVAAACAIAYGFTHSPVLAAAFAGAFAAAAADTWGTEIGTLARSAPRSIVGVTLNGTLAEIAGALVVGFTAWAAGIAPWWIIGAAGFAGALVDSLAGATVQALHYCSRCDRLCETDPHVCGSSANLIRGVRAINNDAVNALATLAGATAAGSLAFYFTAF